MIDVKIWSILIGAVMMKYVAMDYESLEEDNTLHAIHSFSNRRGQPDVPFSINENRHSHNIHDSHVLPTLYATTEEEEEETEAPRSHSHESRATTFRWILPKWDPWPTTHRSTDRSSVTELRRRSEEGKTPAPVKWRIILPYPPHARTTTTEENSVQEMGTSSSTTSSERHHHDHHHHHAVSDSPALSITGGTTESTTTSTHSQHSGCQAESKLCRSQDTDTTSRRNDFDANAKHRISHVANKSSDHQVLDHRFGHDSGRSSAHGGVLEHVSFPRKLSLVVTVLTFRGLSCHL